MHCYEAIDFDGIVRLSNEFKFSVAAFHHAHEAYLVPDLLKRTWGGAPALALFSDHARYAFSFQFDTPIVVSNVHNCSSYKREAYRGSEYAPSILAKHGLRVIMKVNTEVRRLSLHYTEFS